MHREKFRLATWDKGRKLMEQLSKTLDHDIDERGAKLVITGDKFEISCKFDDREFSYIVIKYLNDGFLEKISSELKEARNS